MIVLTLTFVIFYTLYIVGRRNFSIIEGDGSTGMVKFYHKSVVALCVIAPVSFAMAPSEMTLPLDYAMGILFPLHFHVGMNYVITDYIPKAMRMPARLGLLGITLVTMGGLTKLNMEGDGFTHTVKKLWSDKPAEKK
jgi:succinate dehydrogenase (ubiquinone) membrane anchor subunit